MAIRILLVDDHEIILDGFRSLLEGQADMEVVGQATDGRMALELVRELLPDVVLMDVTMPNLSGIETTRQVVHDYPGTRVLALSMNPSRRIVAQMLAAGASGYLVKTCALEELVWGVRAVASGKTYLSPQVAGGVVNGYINRTGEEQVPCSLLSGREREVLQLVAEGLSTKEIASKLHLAVKTIEAHRHNIMAKLNIHSIAGLTKHAVREGLTTLEA